MDAVTPKRPRGRPRLPEGAAHTERIEVRTTPAQRAEWEALGGAEWLREQLERSMRKRQRQRQ